MNVAPRFDVAAGGIECATARHWQLKGVNEQFGLKLLRKSCARIDYDLAGDRIGGILFKFSDARRDC